ncbi:MAG: hypothetical protein H7X99_06740 [Saprospiraceae bacterium]|nr:hypothetical protein [Saprospiraceae bacterium]
MKNLILFLFALLVFNLSCKSKKDTTALLDVAKDQEMLDEYFMAATVGVISAADELKYVLKEPLTNDVSEDVLQKVVTLSPAVAGKVTLSNKTIITFSPNEPLMPDHTYTVSLGLMSLGEKRFDKNIEYQIKTFAQDMTVNREGIIINDDASVSIILGVKTADKVSIDKLKACFTTDAPTIEIIERDPMDYEVEIRFEGGMKKESNISYDGKNIGCDARGVIDLFDLNPNEFGVVYTHHNTSDKEFNIYFSQRLNKQMDLSGLLKVQNENASYTIKNNVITIFLGEIRDQNLVKIYLDKSIRSESGKTLISDHTFDISVQVDNPDAQFVSDGHYFPSEGDFKIPIKTRALDQLRIVVIEIKQENVMHYLAWQSLTYADYYNLRMYGKPVYDQLVPLNQGLRDNEGWTVHGIDLSTRINKNPGSIYHISLEFGPENTTLSCKKELKKYKINTKIPDNDFFTVRDNYYNDYYNYYEDYNWEENNNPCKLAYYVNKQPVHKLFICSDYSVIAKKAGKNYHIAISKLMDLSLVADADITLYNLQAEKMATMRTSGEGFAKFENIRDDAAVLKVEKGKQVTYLALDPNQSNSLTDFDIAGERSETDTEFFAYSDRDIWRPGDSIYVDLMINKAHSDLPKGLPLVMTFYNVDNMVIDEQVQEIDLDNHQIYSFALLTAPNAKTGLYRCMFQIGPKSIRKNIRIETIKPNTAEVIYTFDKMVDNTIYSDQISGSIQAKYLTGFEVGNAGIKAAASARNINNPFPEFKDYSFDVYDHISIDRNFDILDVQTNDKGVAGFNASQELKSFNSPVTLSIETETILPGGGTNKEGKSIIVSPFETYLGAFRKEGTGWSGNHTFKENIEVSLVNLTNKGKLSGKANTVSYTLQQHIESWWVDKYRLRSSGNFVNADFWKDVDNGNIKITGKGKVTFPKGKLGKGAYKLTMTDDRSSHKTQVYFTVYDGIESIPGSQPYIVELQTDKDDYKTGESVKLMLPDIDGAKALISIERGNRIIEQKWYDMTKANNVVVLTTNENWSPNVYIHVTIMQKYKQELNDLPLRLYGVKHIKMDGSNSQLKPIASIPDKLESNKSYTFTMSENEGRVMEYTLALVDEGLLNLTGFATPDPAKHFNGKFPLLVKTWDIYQYLINYFKGKFAGIISIGGDDAYNPDAIAEINRFKPVSIHQGPFKLIKGGKNTHTVAIPNYIGKVRLMVIACNNNNFGKLEKFIPVKNPLMVQSQFPRTLNVTDKLQLPVTILRDDSGINTADLTVKADAGLVKGFTPSRALTFNGKNQLSSIYDIEVLNKTGKLSVEMGISGGGKSMKEITDILINYPNSYESSVSKDIIEPGAKLNYTIKPKGYREVFTSKVMISGLKVPNFTQYAEELIDFPYGCLEQTTSAGFSQMYLDKIIQLDPKENRERMENLQASINKISRFQQSSGKFNYWDGTYYHAWSDIYAGNFMVELKKLNYLPNKSEMLERWINAHTSTANNWALAEVTNDYIYESESLAQAFRLFVLAKGGKPAKSAMNRFVTSSKSDNPMTWWLIAGSFQFSGYDSKAKEYVAKAESLQKNYNENRSYESFGDRGRDWALIVEILSYIEVDKNKLENYYDQMVETLNSNSWASTQTKGFAFIAAYKYFGKSLGIVGKVDYSITGLSGGVKSFQHSAYEPRLIIIDKAAYDKAITIQNKGKGKLYVYQTDRFIDNNLVKDGASSNLGISVDYYNATRKKSGMAGIKLGDDIIISVKISNPSALEVSDLALNLKMPAGWELINPRLYETETSKNTGNYIYQDYKDDRVYTFFNLRAGGSETYSFKSKAAFTGDFYMPALSCEHMYKGTVYARTKTQRVAIGK